MRQISRGTVFAAAALLIGLSAPALAQSQAKVRVVHASPDAPKVDILVNDTTRAFQGTAFGDITNYAPLPAGYYNVKVVPQGGGKNAAVIDANLNLAFYGNYTVLAVGKVAGIEPLVLEDADQTQALLLNPGSARVRFVHASPDAPAVDIKADGGPFLFRNVAFKGVGEYISVPAGRVDLEVRAAGTELVALRVPGLMLKPGTTYTIYATGLLGGSPALSAIVSEDASSPLRPRMPSARR